MYQAVENGIPERGVGNTAMPIGHRDLGDHHGGTAPIAVVQDFEQVCGLGAGERVAQPVVEDEQRGTGQGAQQLGIRTWSSPVLVDTENGHAANACC